MKKYLLLTCCAALMSTLAHADGNRYNVSDSDSLAPTRVTLSDREQSLVARNNRFAFRLFDALRSDGSLVISPLSVTIALGMLNNGAAGQTREEICQTLGFGSTDDAAAPDDAQSELNDFCHKVLTQIACVDRQTRVDMANTIFTNVGYELQDLFVRQAGDYYDAQPQSRDFQDGLTRDVINQWASDHTEGMIRELLSEDAFDKEAVSYLLNALYFDGHWTYDFDSSLTRDEPFGGGNEVPMMWQPFGMFNYRANDLYQAVELPYGRGGYAMTVILPREDKTIDDVLQSMDGTNWLADDGNYQVNLKLPRFDTEVNVSLKEPMQALGMRRAFDFDLAEFPYFCNKPVFVGMMRQAARIQVDEQGTKAAAVTIIGENATGIPKTATFHANRPFLYLISEQSTHTIFFIGQFLGSATAAICPPAQTAVPVREGLWSLSGQRLATPPTHGIYIENGRKRLAY